MNWKTTHGTFLIQKNMARIPFISGGVGLTDSQRFHEAAEYYELTNVGKVINQYSKAIPFSIEDEMTVSNIHLVIGDALYRFYWSQQYRYEVRLKADMLLHDLLPYNKPLPFDVEAVIEAHKLAKR
jgi:hypothetical protein